MQQHRIGTTQQISETTSNDFLALLIIRSEPQMIRNKGLDRVTVIRLLLRVKPNEITSFTVDGFDGCHQQRQASASHHHRSLRILAVSAMVATFSISD